MRKCTACKEEKPHSEFYKNKEGEFGLHAECKACFRKRASEYRRVFRQEIRDLKEASPCMDCGEHHRYFAMQYDHRDQSTKVEMISQMVSKSHGRTAVYAEIEKCDLVCGNCHAYRTHAQQTDL